MSNDSILTVAELIDSAFGEPEGNVVHHKHLQTVLYLLARQLRVLERRVAVQINPNIQHRSLSSLSVTELKLHTVGKKKTHPEKERIDRLHGNETTLPAKSKTESTKDNALTDKPFSDQKSISSNKTTKTKATHTTLTEKEFGDKFLTHQSTTVKELGEKSLTDKPSFGKNLPDKSLTGNSSTDQISTAETSTDKTLTDITSTEKTSTDKTSTDKTLTYKASADKPLTEKSTTDKISTIKTTSDETTTKKASTDEPPTGDSSIDKSFAIPLTDTISSDKPLSDKKHTEKPLRDKKSNQKGSTDKNSSEKSAEISFTVTSTTGRTRTGKSSTTAGRSTMGSQDYQKLLEQLEEMRERELRVIHQRANSREEGNRTPTPIGSLDSIEAKYEKLLIVERVPVEEAEARVGRGRPGTRRSDAGPRLSVVTQEQFETLSNVVREIQQKFGPIGTAELPENAQLMNELRKGASLTDAMAALQLSARLEATEKTIKNMLAIITELARQTSGVQLGHVDDDIEVIFGSDSKKRKTTESLKHHQKSPPPKPKVEKIEVPLGGSPSEASVALSVLQNDKDMSKILEGPAEKPHEDRITYEDLETALQAMQTNIMKVVTDITNRCNTDADNAMKLAIKLEGKIDASLNLGTRMADLENVVSNYAEQVNVLDTGMSSQMTNYQEELTQMQHDLEIGLETMADVLANTGGDATAVAELNSHFSDLQQDIDSTLTRQKELRDIQNLLSLDLDALRREIEILRDTKSDREEVVDALRDKAGLGALNGLISHQQFDAVQGDFEKRIGAAHDKFNNQEIVWQKAIDDLLRELNEKADLTQVEGLRDDINRYLEQFRAQIKFIKDIVGEPCASALSKKINTGTACLSCGNPAHLNEDEGGLPMLPALRPPAIGAEAPKPKEDGDHGLCYPGYPLPHPKDPRSHACHRWCGGSHTLLPNAAKRVPPDMIITQANRNATMQMGTDGKMYAVDEPVPIKPCSYCNKPKTIPERSISKPEDDHSDMVPYDYCAALNTGRVNETISVTPPNYGTD